MQPLLATGATFEAVAGDMGVYVGIQQMEYGSLAAAHLGALGAFAATGSPFSVAAGRISFNYGLKGILLRAQQTPHFKLSLTYASSEEAISLTSNVRYRHTAENSTPRHCRATFLL